MRLLDVFDPETTAVLVVDMQTGYCSPEGALVRQGGLTRKDAEHITRELIPRMKTFLDESRMRWFNIYYATTRHPGFGHDNHVVAALAPSDGREIFGRYNANDTIFDDEGFQNEVLFAHIRRFVIIGVYADKCIERHRRAALAAGYNAIVEVSLTYP